MSEMPTTRLRNFWVSWYTHSEHPPKFPGKMRWPSWCSGYRGDGANVICCAIQAESEQHAWNIAVSAYHEPIEFRFLSLKDDKWSPYSERFQKLGDYPDWPEIPEWEP